MNDNTCSHFCFRFAELPFPCDSSESACADDATFLSFGQFPCGSTQVDICLNDPENAVAACQVRRKKRGGNEGGRRQIEERERERQADPSVDHPIQLK